jgi:carbonic anhydrase/acetyltransferase-like protein (isoleucine patch superfamily)
MVMGSPGRITRQLGERDLAMIAHAAAHYCARAQHYREALRVDPRSGAGRP